MVEDGAHPERLIRAPIYHVASFRVLRSKRRISGTVMCVLSVNFYILQVERLCFMFSMNVGLHFFGGGGEGGTLNESTSEQPSNEFCSCFKFFLVL